MTLSAVCACCLPAAIHPFLSTGGTGPLPKQLFSHSAYLWRNLHSMLLSAGLKILDSECITCLAVATPSRSRAQCKRMQVPFVSRWIIKCPPVDAIRQKSLFFTTLCCFKCISAAIMRQSLMAPTLLSRGFFIFCLIVG